MPEVPIYYLLGHKDAQPRQFTSTFYINYRNSKGVLLTGTVGFTAAVNAGYFHVVAYNNEVTGAADAVLAEALSASKDYYLAAEIHITDVFGPGDYFIWVKGHPTEADRPVFAHASPKYQDLGTKIRDELGCALSPAAHLARAGSVGVDADVAHHHRALRRGLAGGGGAPALVVGERAAHREAEQDRVAMIDGRGPGGGPDPALAHAVELVPVEVPADLLVARRGAGR